MTTHMVVVGILRKKRKYLTPSSLLPMLLLWKRSVFLPCRSRDRFELEDDDKIPKMLRSGKGENQPKMSLHVKRYGHDLLDISSEVDLWKTQGGGVGYEHVATPFGTRSFQRTVPYVKIVSRVHFAQCCHSVKDVHQPTGCPILT
mmetsp:Transcript_1606/g.2214  ORF Transcript_1606/g.2214 Transcript_1606/m.2214 type:complete len:145 (-) Transcript_1606:278-712(-)